MDYGNSITQKLQLYDPGFEKTEYCCKSWDDIRVPAHIQMEGYDVPQYANVQYPWEGREEVELGQIPERFNPVASYVKYFEVPEEMEAQKVFISFQGAESGIAVWLNGNFVGYSEDTFTPSEFELTPYLKEEKTNWRLRSSNGPAAAGVRTRISSVSQVSTVMSICMRSRKSMYLM